MAENEVIHYSDDAYSLIGDPQQARYIRAKDSAISLPLTDSGMVIFIVEPSPAFNDDVLLLPGGALEDGEDPAIAANREMQAEIGYKALRQDYLGEFWPWGKHLRMRSYIYLARDLTPSPLAAEDLHPIRTELVPLTEFERLMKTGHLYDATVIAALYRARSFLATGR